MARDLEVADSAVELVDSAEEEVRVAVPEGAALEEEVAPADSIAADWVEGEVALAVLIEVDSAEARGGLADSIAVDSEVARVGLAGSIEVDLVEARVDLEGLIAAEPAALAGRVDSAKVVRQAAAS